MGSLRRGRRGGKGFRIGDDFGGCDALFRARVGCEEGGDGFV